MAADRSSEQAAPKVMDLVSWVFQNTSYDQNMTLFIDPDDPVRSITAAEARTIVKQLIAGLKSYGLRKGDCVCVHAYNDITYPLLFLAIVGAGGIFTGSNPAYTTNEVKRHLQLTQARFLIADTDLLVKIADRVIESGIKASRIFQLSNQGLDLLPNFASWDDLLMHGEKSWNTFSNPKDAQTTIAALLTTSGTSGLPKAAAHSHQSFTYQAAMLNDNDGKNYEVSRLIALPVFHAFMFPLAHLLPLVQGTPTYIMRRYELSKFLDHIYDYEITETAMVPTVVAKILKSEFKVPKLLRSLRLVICAGSTLPSSTHRDFYRLLRPRVRVIQCWGMTEVGWISTFLHPTNDYTGSVGSLLPGFQAKLLDGDGEIVSRDDTQAEIYIRGPSVMQKYLNDPQATADMIDNDAWLKTGDVAYRKNGLLYIVDRKKELIKVRGWQVSPAELEGQLVLHPLINEAAVIGIATEAGDTELPRAYVVKKPEASLTESDVYNYMKLNLAKYKALDGGVRFVDAIPKNSIGKIVRRVLREVAAAEKFAKQEINIIDTTGRISMMTSTTYGTSRSWTGALSELYASNPPTPMTDYSAGSDRDGYYSRRYESHAEELNGEHSGLSAATPRALSHLHLTDKDSVSHPGQGQMIGKDGTSSTQATYEN